MRRPQRFILITLLFLIPLQATVAENAPLPAPKTTSIPVKIGAFNTLSVRGAIAVEIQQLKVDQSNFFRLDGKQRSPVSMSVKDGTLYLHTDEEEATTKVTVGLHRLHRLIVDGAASVHTKQLTSSSLSIDANTSGRIELAGMFTLNRILSSGSGSIQIQWVDSPRLRIDGSGQSHIRLAGVVNSVEMRLRDESEFHGQYLRVDRMFIQTKKDALAKLLVNNSLRAFAYDNSNIYYYKRPAELTEFTAGSGNILQLGWGQ